MADLKLDKVTMAWVFGAFGWAYALFEIPGGYLAIASARARC